MSAVTSTRSPMVRLMGKRPPSISGRTFSMMTFLGDVGWISWFAPPFSGCADFPEFSFRAIRSETGHEPGEVHQGVSGKKQQPFADFANLPHAVPCCGAGQILSECHESD